MYNHLQCSNTTKLVTHAEYHSLYTGKAESGGWDPRSDLVKAASKVIPD